MAIQRTGQRDFEEFDELASGGVVEDLEVEDPGVEEDLDSLSYDMDSVEAATPQEQEILPRGDYPAILTTEVARSQYNGNLEMVFSVSIDRGERRRAVRAWRHLELPPRGVDLRDPNQQADLPEIKRIAENLRPHANYPFPLSPFQPKVVAEALSSIPVTARMSPGTLKRGPNKGQQRNFVNDILPPRDQAETEESSFV